jgi:hypothetical protein
MEEKIRERGGTMHESNAESHRLRLRHAFLSGEEQGRSEAAVLELILTYALPSSDVSLLAKDLLARFGSLNGVLAANFDRLCQISGVKAYTATLLKLILWLRQHGEEGGAEPMTPMQETLFFEPSPVDEKPSQKKPSSRKDSKPSTPTKPNKSGLFSPALLGEALQVLPLIPLSSKQDEVKASLLALLEYSAASTRNHYANCILRHMFPKGVPDLPLIAFAHRYGGTPELQAVAFYRLSTAQPLLLRVAKELLLPCLFRGGFTRVRLWSWLDERFPGAKGVRSCAQAIVEALVAAGLAKADRKEVTIAARPIPITALAFLLHEEFPQPGRYPLLAVEENQRFQALLWKRQALTPVLRQLVSQGILAEVSPEGSEAEEAGWFTTHLTLEQVLERLIA